jgi:hypothetical protein
VAVEVPTLKLDPYTSTVPTVQMPVQDMEAGSRPAGPLPGNFTRKGTGAAEMGDALFKGILQGHQIKEQRKAEQAKATIAAADSATQGAYQQYQQALQSADGKQDDPKAQAAYKAYTDVFNQAKQTKAKFVIPEKPAKGQKKDKDKQAGGGFSSIKDFFEANPHVVPQIALLTMQPKPQGMSPESTQASQQQKLTDLETKREQQILETGGVELQDAKDRQAAQKVVGEFASLTPEEKEALPSDDKKRLAAATALLYPPRVGTGTKEYVSADGRHRDWFTPGQQPQGWEAAQGAGASASSKLGTLPEVMGQYAKEHGIDPNNMPVAVQKYVKDWYAWKAASTASTSSAPAHLDASGNQVGGSTSSTRGTPEPQPPAGFAPVEGSPSTPAAKGGITPPPSPPSAMSASRSTPKSGGMTAPPSATGSVDPRGTWQQSQNTQRVENEKTTRYQTAQNKYDKAVATNAKTFADDAKGLEKANKSALDELKKEQNGIESWYNQQVHAVHGSVPGDKFKVSTLDGGKVQVEVEGHKITFKTQKDADNFMRDASGGK